MLNAVHLATTGASDSVVLLTLHALQIHVLCIMFWCVDGKSYSVHIMLPVDVS